MYKAELLDLTTEVVAAYVSNNVIDPAQIAEMVSAVHDTLATVGSGPAEPPLPEPAVSVRRSVTPDYIVCLEDGKKLKMLKRHLQTRYNMTPEEYRERWGLAPDYPMVAPNYAARRRELAKEIGLGSRNRSDG